MSIIKTNNIDEDNFGTVRISPQAIETIAKISILEIDGITGINTSFFGRNKDTGKGIKVKISEKDVILDVSLNIKYGYSIPDLANQIQVNVKEYIESMVGLEVLEVNVYFSNIIIE
ncbi:MAG: Asp23/Gls24 family envelope stress response protein [Vulcanibacillus sp.]